MKYRFSAVVVFALFLLLSVGTARADSGSLDYTLTGPVNATFEIPVNFTVPSGDYGLGEGFFVTPLNFTIDGAPAPSDDFLIFCSSSMDGAFEDSDGLFSLTGPQLYTGSENSPTMSNFSGDIPLADYFTGAGGYTLSVTPVPTPEPASIFLIGGGLLSIFLKRRHKTAG